MPRIVKFISLVLLLLAISLPIVSSVNAGTIICGRWDETCFSGDGDD